MCSYETELAMPNITRVSARVRSLQVHWMEPELGGGALQILSYVILWNPRSTDDKGFVLVSSSIFSYRIFNLRTNTRYRLTLFARSSGGTSISNIITTTTSKFC